MSIFTDSVYFQFHLYFIVSVVAEDGAGIKGKGQKTALFFSFRFDDCSRNNSSSTTFTYYVHKFRFFFLSLFVVDASG